MAEFSTIYGNEVTDAALRASMATAYSSLSTYAVGDFCLHGGQLQECNTPITTAEEWTAAHWTAVTVGGEISDLKTDYQAIEKVADAALPHDTASGAIVSFADGADGVPVNDLSVAIEPVQSGSGDPSPTNIRAISGWSEAKVTRCGKNLLNNANAEVGTAWNGSSNAARARLVIPCKPSTTYILSMNGTNGIDQMYYALTQSVPASSSGSSLSSFPRTITTNANTNYIVIGFNKTSISQSDIDALKLQLELGSTASTYEAYRGNQYTISLGDTRYGGTLDVTSGVLTVDKGYVNLTGSEDAWGWSSGTLRPHILLSGTKNNGVLQTNMYPYTSSNIVINNTCTMNAGSGLDIWVADSVNAPDLASWKTFLGTHNLQVVYELASPVTVQLTAQEIATLKGNNVLFCDAGSVSVDYNADSTLFISEEVAPKVVTVSGSTPSITAEAETRYICGTVTSLSFTPSASGICDVRFTSGSTPTVLTLPNTVELPDWFDPTSLDTNTVYEINIMDGVYGVVMAWA